GRRLGHRQGPALAARRHRGGPAELQRIDHSPHRAGTAGRGLRGLAQEERGVPRRRGALEVMDEPVVYLLLCLTAFVAGAINSVAGGGTMLTCPSLMAVMSERAANVTSTVALVPGSFAGAWGYRKELAGS